MESMVILTLEGFNIVLLIGFILALMLSLYNKKTNYENKTAPKSKEKSKTS
jgi:Na+-transporting methylmalonyl-CoA/oxaloacetate decarboxylase gamma subunit